MDNVAISMTVEILVCGNEFWSVSRVFSGSCVCLLSEYGQGRYWDGHSETRGLGGRKTRWWRAAHQVLPGQRGSAGPRAGSAAAPQEGTVHLRRETHTHSLTLYEPSSDSQWRFGQSLAARALLGALVSLKVFYFRCTKWEQAEGWLLQSKIFGEK